MWDSVQSVTGWASLAAFIVAGVVTVIGTYIRGEVHKIEAAPEAERTSLVRDSLEFFHVDTTNLTNAQKVAVAIAQTQARAARFLTSAIVIVLLAIILAVVAIIAIVQQPTPRPQLTKKVASVDVKVESSAANYERSSIAVVKQYTTNGASELCAKAPEGFEVDTTTPGTHGGLTIATSGGDNYHSEYWNGNCFVVYAKENNGRGSNSWADGITVALKKLRSVARCGSDSKSGIKVSYVGANTISVDITKAKGGCTGTDLPKPPAFVTTILFYDAEGGILDSATSLGFDHGHAVTNTADFWLAESGTITIALKGS